MSKLQIFYAEGGRYVSDDYNRASVGDIAFGGELNQTTLFGSQSVYSGSHPFMFVSDVVSDADGALESQTSVDIKRQDIDGLTLLFDTSGGTHPKAVDVTLVSETTPNFTNKIEAESYSMDMTGRISSDGVLHGVRFDQASGELIQEAGYSVTGIMKITVNAQNDIIRTAGIDWRTADAKKTGIATYKRKWSGIREVPVFSAFTSIEEFMVGDPAIGQITIDDEGNAIINPGYDIYSRYFAICMPESENQIVTVAEEITYGETQTKQPVEYIGASASAAVDETACKIEISAKNVSKIIIAFSGVNAPYVRHKLTTMYSGSIREYKEDDIINCDIIEQIDVLSETLPTNVCDITLLSAEGIVFNPSIEQKIEVYRDGDLRGVFYIDNVQKIGKNRYGINAHGATGELEKYIFYGDVYKNKNTKRLIEEIFETANMRCIIEDAPLIAELSGHLPIADCKSTLRTVLFAAGLTLDVSRAQEPHVKYIAADGKSTDKTITETLIGETTDNTSKMAHVQMKTRIYINPVENTDYITSGTEYSHREYGKDYKPIVVIPDVPSVYRALDLDNPVMMGSTANRVLWDGTRQYPSDDTYTTDWAFVLYPWGVRESALDIADGNAFGASVVYDNTLIDPETAQIIGMRCWAWNIRDRILNAAIVGDVEPGENVEIEISDGAVFTGIVTQVRYNVFGNKMIQEVTLRGVDNGPNARRL